MKRLELRITGLPHCPRNRSHAIVRKGKASMLVKTEIARAYEKAVLQELQPYTPSRDAFLEDFDPKTQHLIARWEIYSPNTLTKDGAVSRNSTDLDAHKVLQDTIMAFVGIDDALIVKDTRHKIQGDYDIHLELESQFNDGGDLL